MPTRQIAIAARENRRAHHGMVSTLSTLMPELKRCSRDVTFLAQPGRDEVAANFSPPTSEMARNTHSGDYRLHACLALWLPPSKVAECRRR